ncbi:MAG TPA: arginine--tRNA ligase [Ktedonobacterales bacterium]|nr:arginine--tRNA ligase [Ktedonobacterales bacterium]
MIRDLIFDVVARSVAALREQGALPEVALPAFEIERPQMAAHGDYATNVAMKLAAAAKSAGQKLNPRAVAEQIADRIRETAGVVPAYDLIDGVEVAGPGFINLRLKPAWLLTQADAVIAAGFALGSSEVGRGTRVNLEFVSANPTGPVTVGNGRGGFIGDTLGTLMRAAGYDVTKEYYFNDAGGQIDKLGRSMEYYLRLALGEAEPAKPGEGYFGEYYEGVATRLLDEGARDLLALPEPERAARVGYAAAMAIMQDIKQTMEKYHIDFDVFFNQADLETSSEVRDAIAYLREQGHLEERDGALWAMTGRFEREMSKEGEIAGRVVVRSTGQPTYFASDIAYMRNKFLRGFDKLILVLGPDHHGYIPRLKAVAQMLGHPPEDLHILIYQNVTVKGQRMGKRRGNIITLDELYDDVGPDVTRFFYLMRSSDTHLDFDLDLARKQSDENPGLSVQYAHARAAGVFRKAAEQRIFEPAWHDAPMAALLNDPPEQLERELAMMRQVLRLEEVVARAAQDYAPHLLTRYGMDLADAFHQFYDHCPILKQGADTTPEVRDARLKLLRAAQTGLARTLTLLGMNAPERMEREEAPAAAG